jgi:UDP-GlcNAc:undecaprenyl-phosphate GlcNAc-1-phosphate transferase
MGTFIIALIGFFILELFYFRIADHYNIIDKPNERSSHKHHTLRGGGIIFPLSLVLGVFIFQPHQYALALGVLAIATVSFLDDLITLSNKLRIGVHFLAVALIIFQIYTNQNLLPEYSFINTSSFLFFIVVFIIIIGIINAYNFMDGINGITVLYSLVTIGSIFYIEQYLRLDLLQHQIWMLLIASILVFGFFNIRKVAKAFAGDVGSISMALIICFLILQLILQTENLKWILLLGVYGLDSVATIVCRLLRRENIFKAHRSHFYQYLANETKLTHTIVAFLYAFIQLILNFLILHSDNNLVIIATFTMLVCLYVYLRIILEGRKRLFNIY